MAHELLYDLVRDLAAAVDLPEPIFEFGSLQVEEGQPNDLRPLFAGRDYTGTDLRRGPGVDRVENLLELTLADASIGTALCLDTLEHCEDPLRACREMHRVLRPGGICLVSSVMSFPIHDYPHDYWRFTPEGMRLLLAPFADSDVAAIGGESAPHFVLGIARKDAELGLRLEALPAVRDEQERWRRRYAELVEAVRRERRAQGAASDAAAGR